MHVHCPGPCRKSVLHVNVHAHTACHVHVACSCQCFIPRQCCIPCQSCIPCQCCILCQCFMSMSMSMYIYVEMPECRTVQHLVSPVPDWKKLAMPEQVRYRTKVTQSGIYLVRYLIKMTKIRDAGMPMPALVSSMPMPSYGTNHELRNCEPIWM
jgi:hypothetical protein